MTKNKLNLVQSEFIIYAVVILLQWINFTPKLRTTTIYDLYKHGIS